MTRNGTPWDGPSLFDPEPVEPVEPAPGVEGSARERRVARDAGGSPQRAAELLGEVADGRFGLIDDTDRVVVFEDVTGSTGRVRHAVEEDAITALIRSGCVTTSGYRDRLFCLHGAIRRPVTPLRLTPRGDTYRHRWNALAPIGRATRHERRHTA